MDVIVQTGENKTLSSKLKESRLKPVRSNIVSSISIPLYFFNTILDKIVVNKAQRTAPTINGEYPIG